MFDESLQSSLKFKKSCKLIRWATEHYYVKCFAVTLVVMIVVGEHTKLIERSALLPVSRQSSCVFKQGKPFPRLSVLQVYKQLVVLRLSVRRKSTIIASVFLQLST